jgi:hypothetical protein
MSQNLEDLRRRLEWVGGGNANAGRWALHLERRRLPCGTPGCRCKQGGPLHGPYVYLRVGRRHGRRRRIYVPRGHVETVRRWLRDVRQARANMKLAMRLVAAIGR